MGNEPPILLQPGSTRARILPVGLLALAAGIVMGMWLGRATPALPTATATAEADATGSIGSLGPWIADASVAPELVQAYYATRVTSAGLAPVVCTTGVRLACQGVDGHAVVDTEAMSPAAVQIPGPDELWPELTPAHLDRSGAAVDTIVADDLSPALYSQVTYKALGTGQSWTDGASVTSVSVNGAVVFMDLGSLSIGQYVVLIRQVFSVPPDRYGLHEGWKAIAIEVDG